ncbi:MAG: TonB-dependent receptor [Petrimonas sp.]|nr:TonB-dependent receptor [Petrimonas sp.]
MGNSFLILADNNEISQNQRRITGRVTDAKGELLIGVNVVEVGTTNGTVTDIDGNYTITLTTNNASLQFTYIGFKTLEVKVGAQRVIDVSMEEDVEALDEVVVVGYGTQKKASVVGAISAVEPEQLQLTPSRSISNNLAGMISGVIAVQRSGNPWFNNSDFWIRGVNSFRGNTAPLVLIDGVERSLNNIDPNEIESFSVLKDAAASAVYGVRGANGVIMITTKRGKVGPPNVSARYEYSATAPVKLPEYIGSVKYLELMNEMSLKESGNLFVDEATLLNYKYQTDPDLYPDVYWWKEIAKNNATNSRANVSVNGGTEMLRYALELAYFTEDGILKTDPAQQWNSALKVNRYNVRSNVDINITPTTLLKVNLAGFLQTRNGPPSDSNTDIFYQASRIPPYVHPTIYSNGLIPRVPFKENPWAWATQRGFEKINHSNIESATILEQDLKFITQGLNAKLTFAFDKFSGNSVVRAKNPDYYNVASGRDESGNLITTILSHGEQFLGHTTGADWGNQSVYLEALLNYGRMFNDLHDVNAMLLYNQKEYNDGSALPFRNQGLAGRLSYSYLRKYIAEFNFGYNGSENFAPGKRFGFFPAFAVGWVVSEENFMKGISNTLSNLKFRFSWGEAGNSNIGGRRFAYLPTIADTGYYYWGADNLIYRLGRAEGEIAVENLTWETVAKTNIGLDLGLWNNALTFIVDVFRDKRRDVLMPRVNVPGSAGFNRTPWANYGKVDNQGIDMSLKMGKQLTKDWYLSALANYTYARSKIIEMDEPLSVVGTYRAMTGHPVGQLFGLVANGLYTEDDFDANGNLLPGLPTPENPIGLAPGDIKYIDQNGDNKITALDATAIGGPRIPEIVYGFGINTKYKNVDFGVFFQGVGNTWQILGGENWLPGQTLGSGNIFTNVNDRWTEDNPSQNVFWPRLSRQALVNNSAPSTWWLKDMSFLRLKNVELGMTLPKPWTDKMHINGIRLFVRGSNLFTFSDFKLWDPELETTDGLRYPIMKSVSAGLNILIQ